jgi:hypothetical protein
MLVGYGRSADLLRTFCGQRRRLLPLLTGAQTVRDSLPPTPTQLLECLTEIAAYLQVDRRPNELLNDGAVEEE